MVRLPNGIFAWHAMVERPPAWLVLSQCLDGKPKAKPTSLDLNRETQSGPCVSCSIWWLVAVLILTIFKYRKSVVATQPVIHVRAGRSMFQPPRGQQPQSVVQEIGIGSIRYACIAVETCMV